MKSCTDKSDCEEHADGEQKVMNKSLFTKKVFVARNSILTDLVSANQLNVFVNVSTSLYVLLVTCTTFYYLTAPQEFWRDVDIMLWIINFSQFLKMWLFFNAHALMVFHGFKFWAGTRAKMNTKFADKVAFIAFVLGIAFMFVATPYAMLLETARPLSGLVIVLEQIRISMKAYAFVRECAPRVLKHHPSKDGEQEGSLCPSIKHFLYFLFVPTIVYRDAYPLKEKINWKFVGNSIFLFASSVLICYCLFMRFVVDILQKTGIQPFSLPQVALIIMGSLPIGGVFMLLFFVGVIHSWHNLWAELTRFGDREFYQDWWNSTSFDEYYRKWNIIVNDWLYRYIYIDSIQLGLSRNTSLLLVFSISAVAHEYFISLSLGFFYPSLFIDFLLFSVLLVFLSRRRKSQVWNTILWGSLFFGCGKNVCLYSTEWYARINCERTKDSMLDFFYPRSWDASCQILSYFP